MSDKMKIQFADGTEIIAPTDEQYQRAPHFAFDLKFEPNTIPGCYIKNGVLFVQIPAAILIEQATACVEAIEQLVLADSQDLDNNQKKSDDPRDRQGSARQIH